ncbi:MAG: sigma-70 family RNA polymerase sigma factor [Bacteroidetes bacterium]|nr:sigma-70 family RNA polymerase sigma factor [Bacteroidota bacterium]
MENELEEIINGCAAGRSRAQRCLYDKYRRRMFGICLRYAKDRTEAEDIAQDGFVRIFQNIRSFRGEGSFEGWMKRIMINTALERFRKTDKLHLVADYEPFEDDFDYEDIMGEASGQELMKFIQELSPQYRTVFCLYAIEGYNHIEIGKMLGISEGTSKSNLSRARAVLQEKVRKYYTDYRKRERC